MSNTLMKSASSWTAWPGASIPGVPAASVAYSDAVGLRPRDQRAMRDVQQRELKPSDLKLRGMELRGAEVGGANSCELRVDQRFQDGQGRSVSEHLLGGMSVQAPATAHVGVTVTGDVSGPYPWRPPV
ncbi:hypothetical protein [Actinomadura chibensis]|uniref:Uncharacterized protein n=1 Tax=Actinomadura chibensis TaxID=392828 RepID=A0A5D0NQL9_9ACTN|nr:hypothetical protein [Actinomadura chibensis]TYB46757.1 hypothetical protein FXF69_16310 [Actinomadura chibensis]